MLSTRLHTRTVRNTVGIAAAALAITLFVGCSASPQPGTETPGSEVTLVVHDSFPHEAFEAAATAATGYTVRVVAAGDGGELTNSLVLTQGAPLGDAFFGVDNVYATRVIDAGVVEPYTSSQLPESAKPWLADAAGSLSPITRGATCINIDPAWFERNGIAVPSSYEDLATPEYAPLTVLLDPSSSSTGASFLIGTIAHFGDTEYEEYWRALVEHGARIEQGWSEAYNGQFTQGGGSGTYPIVLSYSSSPAWTVNEAGTESTTVSLPATCSSQVEYAGVLQGASNPAGAQAVVDYLLSPEFQATIAETMYVYPVDSAVQLPEQWQQFATLPEQPNDLSATVIGEHREEWLRAWSDATGW